MTGARKALLVAAAAIPALTLVGSRLFAYEEDLPNLKAPWDFAPDEQKVVGRDPKDVRP
jgi:hypothetical protein